MGILFSWFLYNRAVVLSGFSSTLRDFLPKHIAQFTPDVHLIVIRSVIF